MERLVTSDLEEFAEALAGREGRYLLTTTPTRTWKISAVHLRGLVLALGEDGGGRIYNGLAADDTHHFFSVRNIGPAVSFDGKPFDRDHVAWIAPGSHFHTSTKGAISWLNITVDADLALKWATIHRDEFPDVLIARSWVAKGGPHARHLQELVERIVVAELQSPGLLHSPSSEQHASDQIMRAIGRAFLRGKEQPTLQYCNWHRIIHRALDFIESSGKEAVDTDEMCTAAATSERSLRDAFNAYFGMSPHRYLTIHRLHAIRHSIRHASQTDTIADICTRHGIWDFGRFSAIYRQQFGELPSHALRAQRR